MQKRTIIEYRSSTPMTASEIISAVAQIQQDARELNPAFPEGLRITTHGQDGVHAITGMLESEVELT